MAALGKIRSKGVILICVVGFALFAFIAEELFRSCDSARNESRQQVGEVLGKKINVQDYQKLVDEYTSVMKFTQGRENFTDEELNRFKDDVWENFVQTEVLGNEAAKLGLEVTDEELQDVLEEGTNPMLMRTPFVNRQTGLFDVNQLKEFINEYGKARTANPQAAEYYRGIYTYWTFVEKSLRQQILAQKYNALLGACVMSNPVSAKLAHEGMSQESDIELASFAYSSINDNDANVTDADLKAKYEEIKEMFKMGEETRTIKYVDFKVVPSTGDRTKLNKAVNGYKESLSTAEDPTSIVRQSGSQVLFTGIPQTAAAFPRDIAARLDSIAVGAVYGPVENRQDNTLNVIRLISKSEMPDSVEFRVIQVFQDTPEMSRASADSVCDALRNGGDFETIAKNYGQAGEKAWITSAQYEGSPTVDADTKAYIEALNTAGVNETRNIEMAQGNVVLQVTQRRAMKPKYVAAVIKVPIDFSSETQNAAYNTFSEYVSKSQTLADIEKNAAEYKYVVREQPDVSNSDHYVAGVHSTREALKWIFSAKKGEVSPLYECGDNGNHLMVLVLTGINKKGYRTMDDERVRSYVTNAALRDKKAAMIMERTKGVKDIASARKDSAVVSTVEQITFAAPVAVQATGASEPALSGAVAATEKGKFCSSPVKGRAGVYYFKVNDRRTLGDVKYDEAEYEAKQRQVALQSASAFMQDLLANAGVKDNRYLFF